MFSSLAQSVFCTERETSGLEIRIRSRVVQRAECTLRRKIGGGGDEINPELPSAMPTEFQATSRILNTVVEERVALVKGMAVRARAASLKNVYVFPYGFNFCALTSEGR